MLNRKDLKKHEDRVLNGLIEFYYNEGYKSDQYRDPKTGGIYEKKLAKYLNYSLDNDQAPAEFIEAAVMLESQGFVRRQARLPENPIMGIWPTPKGLDHHDFIQKPWYKKVVIKGAQKWDTILVSILTTLITITIRSCVGTKP
jgi:hypothetical protein